MHILLLVNLLETWLRDDCDGSLYFPDQDGHFNLEANSIAPYSTLVVEGPTASGLNMSMGYSSTVRTAGGLPAQQSLFAASPSSSAGHGPPILRSVVAPKKPSATLIKIMKAKMSPAKKGGSQTFSVPGRCT